MILLGLAISALCAFGALIAAGSVVSILLPGRPEPWPLHLLHRAAGLAATAAAAVYSLGFFGVVASEQAVGDGANSVPAPACRDGFDPATVQGLSHHRASYLPLRFDCVREDGTVYSSDPDYVWMTWTSLSLALAAALLAIGAGWMTEMRARKAARTA